MFWPNLYSARLYCIYFSLIDKLLWLNISWTGFRQIIRWFILTDFYTIVAWLHTLFFTYVSCCVSYLTLLMANIKNRKKLQLIQTIWDVMLYSQHFTFHWKLLVLVSRIQKCCTGGNNFDKWKETFRSDRPKWPDRSKWTTFKAGPEYSGWMESAPCLCSFSKQLSIVFDVMRMISTQSVGKTIANRFASC